MSKQFYFNEHLIMGGLQLHFLQCHKCPSHGAGMQVKNDEEMNYNDDFEETW
ncbi:MAG: hypothetical protein AB7W47_04100 [Calditrichaceae bacterium]